MDNYSESTNKEVLFEGQHYPKEDLVAIGTVRDLYIFSRSKKDLIKHFASIAGNHIICMAKTNDYKSLFINDANAEFIEIDMCSGKRVHKLNLRNIFFFVLTHDNEYILTCQSGNGRGNVEKYSLSSGSLISTANKYERNVQAMNCSLDNKLLFVGYEEGIMEIIDIESFNKI